MEVLNNQWKYCYLNQNRNFHFESILSASGDNILKEENKGYYDESSGVLPG